MTKIAWHAGHISLNLDGTWSPSEEALAPLARVATALSRPPFYTYRPSHGGYGPLLAHMVARRIGGKVVVPPPPPGTPPDDIVF